jgi:hypothetical protein
VPAEAEKLRDMVLTKEGENNELKEKITSLKEDIDTVHIPSFPTLTGTFLWFTDLPVRSRVLAVCRRATITS